MKIQLFSDLHNEFYRKGTRTDFHIKIHPQADVIVLAGDIDVGIHGLRFAYTTALENDKPVIFIPGNHEYYTHNYDELSKKFAEGSRTGVKVLHNSEVIIDDVRFVGGTLWTDFALYENSNRMPSREEAITEGDHRLNDFRIISVNDPSTGSKHCRFSAKRSAEEHDITRTFINKVLDTPFDGKTVVCTHHAPSVKSIHSRFAPMDGVLDSYVRIPGENNDWKANGAFASNLTSLIVKADVWVHGHVHNSFEYQIDKCRVYANPRGYPIRDKNGEPGYENREYNPALLIEV